MGILGAHVENLRIVLLGKTGSGKSSTGNTILGQDVFSVSFSSESTTQHCEKHEGNVGNRNISVIDTPGLYNTSNTHKTHLKAEIEKSLQMSGSGPHVFLLVIKLDRFTKEEMETVKWIQKNLGGDVIGFTMLLFTGADMLNKPLETFLQENPELMKVVGEYEGRYHAFNNVEKKDGDQVTQLLKKIKKVVEKNKGGHYTIEMFKKTQRKIFILKCLTAITPAVACCVVFYLSRKFWYDLFCKM